MKYLVLLLFMTSFSVNAQDRTIPTDSTLVIKWDDQIRDSWFDYFELLSTWPDELWAAQMDMLVDEGILFKTGGGYQFAMPRFEVYEDVRTFFVDEDILAVRFYNKYPVDENLEFKNPVYIRGELWNIPSRTKKPVFRKGDPRDKIERNNPTDAFLGSVYPKGVYKPERDRKGKPESVLKAGK